MADPREQAVAVRERCAADILALRADLSLDKGYRLQAMAKTWIAANDQMAALRSSFTSELTDDKAELEMELYSPPGPKPASEADRVARIEAYRNALDRAERSAQEGEAGASELQPRWAPLETVLKRAIKVGDDFLERAAFVIASERGWRNVINIYADRHPDEAEKAMELLAVKDTIKSPEFYMRAQFSFVLPKPTEFAMSPSWQIERIAAGKPQRTS